MKFLSIKKLILCILLPPIFYVSSVQSIEKYIQYHFSEEIHNVYLGDTQPLLDGSLRIRDALSKNLDHYLQKKIFKLLGVSVNIFIGTKTGTILYPNLFDAGDGGMIAQTSEDIALENFRYMEDGLNVDIDLTLKHNTIFTNLLLLFYILSAALIFYYYFKQDTALALHEYQQKNDEIDRLLGLEEKHTNKIESLGAERIRLAKEIDKIKNELESDKIKASRTEDQMIDEIEALEKKIEITITRQQSQHEENELLREKIEKFEKSSKRSKATDLIKKRFKILYKRIMVRPEAIKGFNDLTDDMKLKCEEVIHQLNENPEIVPIKRKIYGRHGRKTFFEVMFAYNGRLYWGTNKSGSPEILIIGNKNTQTKDLRVLETIQID